VVTVGSLVCYSRLPAVRFALRLRLLLLRLHVVRILRYAVYGLRWFRYVYAFTVAFVTHSRWYVRSRLPLRLRYVVTFLRYTTTLRPSFFVTFNVCVTLRFPVVLLHVVVCCWLLPTVTHCSLRVCSIHVAVDRSLLPSGVTLLRLRTHHVVALPTLGLFPVPLILLFVGSAFAVRLFRTFVSTLR